MSYENERLEIIRGIRHIEGLENISDEECLGVYYHAMELEHRLGL